MTFANLPDPEFQHEFYDDVIAKRVLAWIADGIVITLLTVLAVLFTAFTALFFLGFLTLTISLLYRWATIAAWSATPGMRLFAIELRTTDGHRLPGWVAFWHSALFLFFKTMVLPLILSMVMMLTTRHGQSLHDAVTGVVAINRPGPARLASRR